MLKVTTLLVLACATCVASLRPVLAPEVVARAGIRMSGTESTDYRKMTKKKLQAELKAYGLKSSGNKKDLIVRLETGLVDAAKRAKAETAITDDAPSEIEQVEATPSVAKQSFDDIFAMPLPLGLVKDAPVESAAPVASVDEAASPGSYGEFFDLELPEGLVAPELDNLAEEEALPIPSAQTSSEEEALAQAVAEVLNAGEEEVLAAAEEEVLAAQAAGLPAPTNQGALSITAAAGAALLIGFSLFFAPSPVDTAKPHVVAEGRQRAPTATPRARSPKEFNLRAELDKM